MHPHDGRSPRGKWYNAGVADQERSYHRAQFWLGVARLALTVGLLAVFLFSGATLTLRRWTEAAGHPRWLQVAELLLLMSVALRLASAPLTWLSGYRLPRRVGLLHQPFWLWAVDHAKAVALNLVLTLLGAEVIYALLSVTPWWWLWGAAAFSAGGALLAMVVPVWIVPLFYRLSPLGDAALRERLIALAARMGVPVVGV